MVMKCGDVRNFFSQVSGRNISVQVQPQDLEYLATNGYIILMDKSQYDQMSSDVAALAEATQEQQKETMEERGLETSLEEEEMKTHSILFHFEGREKRESEIEKMKEIDNREQKEKTEISSRESVIRDLIQKKSVLDRMVPFGDKFVSLTGPGTVTLSDLNVRNYRVSEEEFSTFRDEISETSNELKSIAENSRIHETNLASSFPESDISLLWGTSIGLAKMQGQPGDIYRRFIQAYETLRKFHSTFDNKLMAAEIITSMVSTDSQRPQEMSYDQLILNLENLDHELRHHLKVPNELSAGVAAIILFGRKFDGTYPIDRFSQFASVTSSYESAAVLSVLKSPVEELTNRFLSFRSLFSSWGYHMSDDTELASAFLSASGFSPQDVSAKLTIIVNGLKAYLEYPLVAAAVLASIQVLEANETLDLLEKAYSVLGQVSKGLERSELLSLSVRMIHGIKNELVKDLDPTARITNTPIQFTYMPSNAFFVYYVPMIVAHSSYYSTFSGIGGFHPAHVHGVGGFSG